MLLLDLNTLNALDFLTNSLFITLEEFKYKLLHITDNIIGKEFPFEGCVIAGGALLNLIKNETFNINSDIDIWITGKYNNKKIYMSNILNYLSKFNCKFIQYTETIVNVILPNKIIIQIINTLYKNPITIINMFDLDIVKMYYDGKNVYLTPTCVKSICNNTIINSENFIIEDENKYYNFNKNTGLTLPVKYYRIKKYIERGYNFDCKFINNKESKSSNNCIINAKISDTENVLNKKYYDLLMNQTIV